MIKRVLIIITMLCASASSVADTKNGDKDADNVTQRHNGLRDQMGKVVFIDHELNRKHIDKKRSRTVRVTAEQYGSRSSATGTKEVFSTFKNRTDFDMVIEARTSFFGSGYFPLDDVSAWKQVYIPANGVATYRDSSISFDAVHYMIEVRQPGARHASH